MWSEVNANGTRMGRLLTKIEWIFIKRALSLMGSPRTVLDIGGGDGRFARRLQEFGITPILLEKDTLPVFEYKSRDMSGSPLLLADGNYLPLAPESVDCMMAIEVPACTDSAHIEGFLDQCQRVLKENGYLVFTSYNKLSFVGINKLLSPRKYKFTQYESYTETYTITLKHIARSGFELIDALGFRWAPFARASNNPLVPLFGFLEQRLKLQRIPQLSPWLFWIVCKRRE
jgi:ubiquinone/menaquinone biosynthesis C-methylase UbiE